MLTFIYGAVLAELPYSQSFCPDVCLFTILVYLTWIGNGLADFDEIWQALPLYAVVLHLRKLAPRPVRCLSTDENLQNGLFRLMFMFICGDHGSMGTGQKC